MTDRVLDRIPSKPDPIRQLRFSVAEVVRDLTPRSYTWTVGQVLQQGEIGACVGHGFAHEAIAKPVVVRFPHPVNANTFVQSAQEFAFWLYEWAKDNDEWEGDQYSGTSVAAGAKGMKAVGMMPEYRWTRDADELAVAVSRKGPCVIGVDWWSRMMDADSSGFLHVAGQVEGGHCILVNGYSTRLRAFRVHQSWGPDWGREGEALISHDDMDRLMDSGGEGCLPIRRHL